MFTLDNNQLEKLAAWMRTKPESRAADGAQYEYCFLPTGLGVIVKVKCHVTNTEVDLTDYASW